MCESGIGKNLLAVFAEQRITHTDHVSVMTRKLSRISEFAKLCLAGCILTRGMLGIIDFLSFGICLAAAGRDFRSQRLSPIGTKSLDTSSTCWCHRLYTTPSLLSAPLRPEPRQMEHVQQL